MIGGIGVQDHAQLPGNSLNLSPLSQTASQPREAIFKEEFDLPTRGASIVDGSRTTLSRVNSARSQATIIVQTTPSRGSTLKKKSSVRQRESLKRSGSRELIRSASATGFDGDRDPDRENLNSAFFTSVPTGGIPTVVLAERFEAWRKVLRDLITYFREIHSSYEQRAKCLHKVNTVLGSLPPPTMFMREGGMNEAIVGLGRFHSEAYHEELRAKEIETEVINQLTGLRGDLKSKIKEIKGLAGDFKNSVDSEMEGTRRVVRSLQEAINLASNDLRAVSGKGDPFIVRLAVDRQVERQIDEENYLHRAFLNLEGSGRELDSIVVGEIQKAYGALANILKREADANYGVVEGLRNGPIAMPKDREWSWFVEHDANFVDPRLSLRNVRDIEYPGRHHPLATEVRAGMLERKSKYLKSYTPGWYVLTATHLHEFKSADRIHTQAPVVSLLLGDQKLGSRSQVGSSSHKFMLKGRQTGTMHRGHSWVFRAESHETMLAWYEDIHALTEKTGLERDAFVRKHARSVSNSSQMGGSISSDGGIEDEDEADAVPFSAPVSSGSPPALKQSLPKRPQPGGRFPSDLQVDRGLQAALSVSSASSGREQDLDTESNAAISAGSVTSPSAYMTPSKSQRISRDEASLTDVGSEEVSDLAEQKHRKNQANDARLAGSALHPPAVKGHHDRHPRGSGTSTANGQVNALGANKHESTHGAWMGPADMGAASGGRSEYI